MTERRRRRLTGRPSSKSSEGKVAYGQAIEATTQAIGARAQRYRSLVVAVALTISGSFVAALIMWSWRPLLAVGMILPLYGAFALVDGSLLLGWQRQLLDLWVEYRLDLRPLRDVLSGFPGMPPRTLEGMLSMLPLPRAANATELRSQAFRRAVAFVMREYYAHQHIRTLLVAASHVVAVLCIGAAVVRWWSIPLLGLVVIPLLLALGTARLAISQGRWCREVVAWRQAGLEAESVKQALADLELGSGFEAFVERHREILDQEAVKPLPRHPQTS